MDLNETMNVLLNGTEFEVMTNSKVLTTRKKVKTPIEALNCLLGGGLPVGIIAHIYGEPRGGKSTFFYQVMGLFQKQYPDGISIIIDMESSADPERLKILGVDVDRVVRLPATSIENGFLALLKLIQNKEETDALKDVPIFVIWDTISKGLATDSTIQSRMAAMDRARVIKGYMSEIQKHIEKQDFFLGLINQIIYTTDKYGNRKATAGGGIALQHDNQISFFVKLENDEYDEYGMLVNRVGSMKIDKSKISPEIQSIPYYMDVTNGAKIKDKESFFSYMNRIGIVDQGSKGWYSHSVFYEHEGSDEYTKRILDKLGMDRSRRMRWNDFKEFYFQDVAYDLLKHVYMNLIEKKFALQKEVMKEYHMKVIEDIKENLLKIYSEDEVSQLFKDDEVESENVIEENVENE
jgi:RecA/RadA recombinase